jgi:hypothetical protein
MRDPYYQIEALSASGAKALLKSPLAYRHAMDAPRADTDAFRFGRLVHALTLQPQIVDDLCVVLPPRPDLSQVRDAKGNVPKVPAATEQGKAILAPWQAECDALRLTAEAGEQYALAAADWAATKADAQPLADALLDAPHPETGWTLRTLLRDCPTMIEVAIAWQASTVVGDADAICPCKAKPDAVVSLPDGSVMCVDLKTTSADLTAADLSRTIAAYGYHRQAAHYLDALASQGVVDATFLLVFVAKEPPHDACWIRLSQEALSIGAAEMQTAKAIFAACTKAERWPGAQASGMLPVEIGLPKWYRPED